MQWDVPCMAEFYDSAYGVVKGCTPSVVKCTRIVRDGFARQVVYLYACVHAYVRA
jgi:hypothetical protein